MKNKKLTKNKKYTHPQDDDVTHNFHLNCET